MVATAAWNWRNADELAIVDGCWIGVGVAIGVSVGVGATAAVCGFTRDRPNKIPETRRRTIQMPIISGDSIFGAGGAGGTCGVGWIIGVSSISILISILHRVFYFS